MPAAEFSRRCGFSDGYCKNVELGSLPPSRNFVSKISSELAKATGLDATFLRLQLFSGVSDDA